MASVYVLLDVDGSIWIGRVLGGGGGEHETSRQEGKGRGGGGGGRKMKRETRFVLVFIAVESIDNLLTVLMHT